VSYLLLRAARWGALEQAPPNEAGRTLIPPIPAARREALERIAAGGDHRLLVEVAEEVFVEAPLLLDAQRYLVQGMGGIGAEMKQAQDAVLSSLAVLLRRVEQLPDLSFNDGTPFADGATREWIETRVKP